jgi:hypothetical protein
MGGITSTHGEAELTSEEKAQISGKVQLHYAQLKRDGSGDGRRDDIVLFDALKR